MYMLTYQMKTSETAVYPAGIGLTYTSLGLAGEAGEIANKVKKVYRDDNGVLTNERREQLKDELGDLLWYAAQFAEVIGVSLSDVAECNLRKLESRAARGTLQGDGDKR